MKLTIIGYMKSHLDKTDLVVSNETSSKMVEELKRFAGAEAGICYMSKPYFDSYVTDEIKALNRFSQVASTGHHSIAGHSQVAMLFEGIPKIVAMYLNNLGCYETSEKSGRYTIMTGNSEREVELYDKWCKIIANLIERKYGDKVDERTRTKLAQENSRYLLSVFIPTTMGYTTSIRQWNYIIDWCERFQDLDTPTNYFFRELKKYFKELGEKIKELLYVEELRDIKNRLGFDMILYDKDSVNNYPEEDFVKGKLYCYHYKSTFAEFAQAHRHRTLSYRMIFTGVPTGFYTPSIIAATEYQDEWERDIWSLMDIIPNGSLVPVEEMGEVMYFFLKSMERNCGRAQLEIMQQNLKTAEFIYNNRLNLSPFIRNEIHKYYIDDKPKMKGQLLKCKEPCIWGCNGSKKREI